MPYTQFNGALPNGAAPDSQTGPQVLQSIRDNQNAVRDMAVVGAGFGWNYDGSTGTDDQASVEYFSKGTEKLKIELTWGTTGGATGQIATSAYSYSSDSGATYSAIGTETRTYNAKGRVTATAWS